MLNKDMNDFFEYFLKKYKVDLKGVDSEVLLNKLFEIGGQEGVDFIDDYLIYFDIHGDEVDIDLTLRLIVLVLVWQNLFPRNLSL